MKKLIEELKKNPYNSEVLKEIKKDIKNIAKNKVEIERVLDLMKELDCYIGFDRDIIINYLKILKINLTEKDLEKKLDISLRDNLIGTKKLRYLKIILYYEIKKFKEVITKQNIELKEKMMKIPEYKLINFLIKIEEKSSDSNLDSFAKELKREWEEKKDAEY